MTLHQSRRFWLLWAPIVLSGVGIEIAAGTRTVSPNGLTLLGAVIAVTGLAVAALDERAVRGGRLP